MLGLNQLGTGLTGDQEAEGGGTQGYRGMAGRGAERALQQSGQGRRLDSAGLRQAGGQEGGQGEWTGEGRRRVGLGPLPSALTGTLMHPHTHVALPPRVPIMAPSSPASADRIAAATLGVTLCVCV